MEIENVETIFVLVTQQINQHKLSSLKYITKMYSAFSLIRHAFLFKTHLYGRIKVGIIGSSSSECHEPCSMTSQKRPHEETS